MPLEFDDIKKERKDKNMPYLEVIHLLHVGNSALLVARDETIFFQF